jgi:hypothetical protein
LDSQKISMARAFGKVDKRQMIIVGSPNLGGWRSSAVARRRAAPQRRSKDVGLVSGCSSSVSMKRRLSAVARRSAVPQQQRPSMKENGAPAP